MINAAKKKRKKKSRNRKEEKMREFKTERKLVKNNKVQKSKKPSIEFCL